MVNRYGDEAYSLPTNSRGQRPLVAAGVLAPYRRNPLSLMPLKASYSHKAFPAPL